MGTPVTLRQALNNKYLLWLVLALPGVWLVIGRFVLHTKHFYLALSGEWSCYLLVLTMAITPLQMLLGPLPWLRRRRRYFGVASFGYAALHLVVWLAENHKWQIIRSFTRPDIITGSIAFALMILLAITSTDGWVRRMGPKWKALQRWVYPAAFLTFLHWVTTTEHVAYALLWSVPLMVAGIWRLMRHQARLRRS